MSDLNMNISAEEQNEIEGKIVALMGGNVIPTYSSIATIAVSIILSSQQKPANLEEILAKQEIYCNALKKLFGVDETTLNIEKIKAYYNINEEIKAVEERIIQQQMMEAQQSPEETIDPENTEVVEATTSENIEEANQAIAEAQRNIGSVNTLPITEENKDTNDGLPTTE